MTTPNDPDPDQVEYETEDLSGQTRIFEDADGNLSFVEYNQGVSIRRPAGGRWVLVDDPALTTKLDEFYRRMKISKGHDTSPPSPPSPG